jgi:hypothetical protein
MIKKIKAIRITCDKCNLQEFLYKHDHKFLCMECLSDYFPKIVCSQCNCHKFLFKINSGYHLFCYSCIVRVGHNYDSSNSDTENSDTYYDNICDSSNSDTENSDNIFDELIANYEEKEITKQIVKEVHDEQLKDQQKAGWRQLPELDEIKK